MLTRKDYKAIAAIIQNLQHYPKLGPDVHVLKGPLTTELADYMAVDNPRFDYDKFIAACYGEIA